MKLFKKAKRGFTLVELVVVIAVIAILAAVSVGAYFGITESANSSRLEQEAKAAHTNIQLVAMNQDDNSNLTREGLYINDLDTFETKMESYSGFHYDVVAQEPSAVNNPTLYFCNETGVSSANIVNQRFNTFKYYNPEVGNKRASVNIPSGDITIEEATFELGNPEPIIIKSIGFDGISETVDNFFVGDRKTFNVVTEPVGLGYAFEIENSDVVKIEGSEIVAIGAGTSKVTVKSGNLDSDGNQLTDEITVNVTEVEIVELIVNGFTDEYIENTPIDTEVSYQLRLNNGKTVDVQKNTVTISETNATLELTQVQFTYSGNYGEATTTIPIVVNARELIEISASVQTIDTSTYFENGILDISDITFTAHYDNNETEDITNLISYDNVLKAEQENITFKYNEEEITIGFSHAIPAIVLENLTYEVGENAVNEYEVGSTANKTGIKFTAHFNNGTRDVTDDVVITNPTVAEDTTEIIYSYTFKEVTKTVTLPIVATKYKTFYFEDRSWWHKDGAVPYIQLTEHESTSLGKVEVSPNDIVAEKVDGSEVGSLSKSEFNNESMTGSSVWKFTIDTNKWAKFKIYRVEPLEKGDTPNYWGTCTKSILISSLGENNLITITNQPTWDVAETDEAGNPSYTLGIYNEENPIHNKVYLMGLDENWDTTAGITSNNEMVFDKENNVYKIENVEMPIRTKIKFFAPSYNYYDSNGSLVERFIGLNDVTSFIVEAGENSDIIKSAFNANKDSFGNFVVSYECIGKYTITIDLNQNVVFTLVEKIDAVEMNTDWYFAGRINGNSNWVDDYHRFTTFDDKYAYITVELIKNDEFKFRFAEGENNWANQVNGTTLSNEAKQYFKNGADNNITVIENGYIFTFKLDLINLSFSIESATVHNHIFDENTHLCRCEEVHEDYKLIWIDPTDEKAKDGAWFALWVHGSNVYADTRCSLKTAKQSNGYFRAIIHKSYTKFNLVRLNPGYSEPSWDAKRNQTKDITIDANNNLFKWTGDINDGGGTWSKI